LSVAPFLFFPLGTLPGTALSLFPPPPCPFLAVCVVLLWFPGSCAQGFNHFRGRFPRQFSENPTDQHRLGSMSSPVVWFFWFFFFPLFRVGPVFFCASWAWTKGTTFGCARARLFYGFLPCAVFLTHVPVPVKIVSARSSNFFFFHILSFDAFYVEVSGFFPGGSVYGSRCVRVSPTQLPFIRSPQPTLQFRRILLDFPGGLFPRCRSPPPPTPLPQKLHFNLGVR